MNEYVNAGIEGIKITEESVSHHTPQVIAPSIPNYITSVNNSEPIESNLYNRASALINDNENSSGEKPTYDDNTVEDLQSSNVSNGTINVIEQTKTSEKIELTSDLPSYDESENIQDSLKNIPESESSIHDYDETTSTSDTDETQSTTSDEEKATDPEIGDKTIDTAAESVDIQTELSSVVPPTSMSLEVTASHESDTALPDVITDKSNEILAKETNNHIENEKINVKGHEEKYDKVHIECQLIDAENNAADTSKSNERFIKPITFETAATMDDVSDTELESYLQELEDLEENAIKINSECVKSAVETIKLEDEPYGNESIYNLDNTIGNIDEIHQRDDRNADSFSQASTVEFGEVNATSSNDQPPNPHLDQNIETIENLEHNIDASENDDLVIDTEQTVEIAETQHESETQESEHEQIQENIVSHCPVEETENEHDRDISSDLEPQTECSGSEIDEQPGNVAKRPNSLNLQNCNSILIDKQNPSNFSSSENAGNTPAACGQFLSSSISSDDSNIAIDNNQMIVS